MKTKDVKPKVCYEYSHKDYLLALKHLMKSEGISHVTGLPESPMAMGRLKKAELIDVVNHAIRKGVFYGNDKTGFRIDPTLHMFLEKYAKSQNIVAIHKPSYKSDKLISFGRSGDVFLCTISDCKKDRTVCLADNDLHVIYSYIREEIEKKDPDKAFSLKKANKQMETRGENVRFTLKAENRLALCSLNNSTGKSIENEVVLHIQKDEYEYITMRPVMGVEARKSTSAIERDICSYIELNCPANNDEYKDSDDEDEDTQNEKKPSTEDPESFSMLSYVSLTGSPNFPKTLWELIKRSFKVVAKATTKKLIIRQILLIVITALLWTVWNIFGTCYLNDTFRLDTGYSKLGLLVQYLFAGDVSEGYKGLSIICRDRSKDNNTAYMAGSLYILITVLIRSFIADIKERKIGKNLVFLFGFGKRKEVYRSASVYDLRYFFYVGLIVASFVNLLIYNPVSVALLGVMIIVSVTKGDNSRVTGPLMITISSFKYKKVNENRWRMPRISHIQLCVLHTGYGLLINSVLNLLLWYVADFKPIVRFIMVGILIIYGIVQLILAGKNNRLVAKVGLYILASVGAVLLIVAVNKGILLADDGGWTESGRSLWGLLHNSGFPYIFGLSAVTGIVVALTAAMVFSVGGLPLLLIGGAGALATSIWASKDDNYKVAANLLAGDKSPYADDPEAALKADLIDVAVGFIPVAGDIIGVMEGVRDVSYGVADNNLDIWWDVLGLGFSVIGLHEAMEIKGAEKVIEGTLDNVDDLLDGGSLKKLGDSLADGNMYDIVKNTVDVHDDTETFVDIVDNVTEIAMENATKSNNTVNSGSGYTRESKNGSAGKGHTRENTVYHNGGGYSRETYQTIDNNNEVRDAAVKPQKTMEEQPPSIYDENELTERTAEETLSELSDTEDIMEDGKEVIEPESEDGAEEEYGPETLASIDFKIIADNNQ